MKKVRRMVITFFTYGVKVFGNGLAESRPVGVVVQLVDDHFLSVWEFGAGATLAVVPQVIFARWSEHEC